MSIKQDIFVNQNGYFLISECLLKIYEDSLWCKTHKKQLDTLPLTFFTGSKYGLLLYLVQVVLLLHTMASTGFFSFAGNL